MFKNDDSSKKSSKKKSSTNVHEGHRSRMKQKYVKFGIDQFYNHEILEMLLYYAIPRKDTNPIASRLIAQFGSFSKVFDASIEELTDANLSYGTAFYIKFILAAQDRYTREKVGIRCNMTYNYDDVYLLSDILHPKDVGSIATVVANSADTVVYKGVIDEKLVGNDLKNMQAAIEKICYENIAKRISVAYRAKGEYTLPRVIDVKLAARLNESLKKAHITLSDYFIVNDSEIVSMRSLNLFFESAKELEEKHLFDEDADPKQFVFPLIDDMKVVHGL